MGFTKPFLIFGGSGAPKGGLGDYLGAGFTLDEVDAVKNAAAPTWWQIVVLADDGPVIVRSSDGVGEYKAPPTPSSYKHSKHAGGDEGSGTAGTS